MGQISLDKTFPARPSSKDEFEFEYTQQSSGKSTAGKRRFKRRKVSPPASRARKRRGATSPLGKTPLSASSEPRGQTRTRAASPDITRPDTAVDLTALTPSAEVERKQSLSSALLKSAAFVQPSSVSGTLQGLLSGAGIGTEIDAAMQHYRDRKRSEAKAAQDRKRTQGVPTRPATRANFFNEEPA